jgi:hypothetical protein
MQRDHPLRRPGEKLLACIHFPAAGAQKVLYTSHSSEWKRVFAKTHPARERKATNAAAQRRPFNRLPLDRQWELSKGHKRIRAAERKKGMKSRVCGHAGSQNTHCVCPRRDAHLPRPPLVTLGADQKRHKTSVRKMTVAKAAQFLKTHPLQSRVFSSAQRRPRAATVAFHNVLRGGGRRFVLNA